MIFRHFQDGYNPIDPAESRFLIWCDEYDKIMRETLQESESFSYIQLVGDRESFKEMFDEGLSPDEAVDEESAAWST